MSTAAVVLAAGGGTRFEGPTHKLLVLYRGRPIVAAALDNAASAGLDELVVVQGAVDLSKWCPPGTTVLDNSKWESGLASSLQVAISWCRTRGHDAVVVGLGDSPAIPPSAWRAVSEAAGEVAVATDGERRPPVRLARSVWDDLPSSGDAGARALWHRDGTVIVECTGDPSDIDTASDLHELVERDRS